MLAHSSGQTVTAALSLTFAGAILGFLRFNTYPASVFMGDAGSQLLGFAVGVLSLRATQSGTSALSAATPILLLALPILDTLSVMAQRVSEGRSPFSADKNHIHHKLLALGFDHHEAVMVIYAIQADLFLLAYWMRYESDLSILGVVSFFFIVSLVLFQSATRRGWRFRAPLAAARDSPLTRLLATLLQPDYLPRWSYVAVAIAVGFYAVLILAETATLSGDVEVLLIALFAVTCFLLAILRSKPLNIIEKAVLYVTVAILVYLDNVLLAPPRVCVIGEWTAVGLAALATIVRLRLAADRRFVLTPLDLIILFVCPGRTEPARQFCHAGRWGGGHCETGDSFLCPRSVGEPGRIERHVAAVVGGCRVDGLGAASLALTLMTTRAGDMRRSCHRHVLYVHFPAFLTTDRIMPFITPIRVLATIALALSSVALAACGGAEARKAKHLEKGHAYLDASNYEKARVEFQNALQISPIDPEARFENGVVDEKLGRSREAAQFYQSVIDVNPDHVDARINLARLYLFAGAPDKTLELIAPGLAKNPDNAELLTLRAAARVQKKEVGDALVDAERAVQLEPSNEDAVSALAGIYSANQSSDKAEALLENAIKRVPGTATLRLALVQVYSKEHRSADVERVLLELVHLEPAIPGHRIRLAQFYSQQNQLDAAEQALRNGIKVIPNDRDLKLSLVDYLSSHRSPDSAEHELHAMIDAAPGDVELKFALARLYVGNHRSDRAEKVLREVIDAEETERRRNRGARSTGGSAGATR